MQVKWVEDTRFIDCWDLESDRETIAYIMRPSETLMWFRENGETKTAPSQDVEEAKVIIQAMVLLEG